MTLEDIERFCKKSFDDFSKPCDMWFHNVSRNAITAASGRR